MTLFDTQIITYDANTFTKCSNKHIIKIKIGGKTKKKKNRINPSPR